MQELKQKGYLTIILAILVTAILVGGAVFIWQDQAKKAEVQKATTDLQADIDAMQANLPAEEAANTENVEAEDPTADWQVYTNTEAGFSFKYPKDLPIANVGPRDIQELSYYVEVQLIDDLPGTVPLGMDKATALKNRDFLAQGNIADVHYDWSPVTGSVKLIDLGDVNARSFTILGRFEVGDITFERKLLFYVGDYQVDLTVYGPVDDITGSISKYFTQTKEWKDGAMAEFYSDLANNNSSNVAQEWFDTFDQIVETIEIN